MSNSILTTLALLQDAHVGNPELDEQFACAMGYQRSFSDSVPTWRSPDGKWLDKLPHWTTNLADALLFLGQNTLFTLESGDINTFSRAIGHLEMIVADGGPPIIVDIVGEAHTLPLAVCVLALQIRRL